MHLARKFRSVFVFSCTPKSARVSFHFDRTNFAVFLWFCTSNRLECVLPMAQNRLARIFPVFCVFALSNRLVLPLGSKSPYANSAVFLCFRLECLPSWTKIVSHEFRSFLCFRAPSKSARVLPLGSKSPCANSITYEAIGFCCCFCFFAHLGSRHFPGLKSISEFDGFRFSEFRVNADCKDL